ncbi:hypothetical protein BGZ65_012636 [Modicella reniformis]|uniref:BAR-domain-containing protein n=1 Tax=Modicella reniformis TaxID=1440133 RepID=A0A9P6J323_9FUNG|nr:hypothetical protein BGZ65_012636 [Modicella reniformis]
MNNKFTECEKTTTTLMAEVSKYRDSVAVDIGVALTEIYDPSLGEPSGEVTPRRTQTAPESVQAVEDYQAVMTEIRDLLLPELDKVEDQVMRPLTEMQNIMKMIRKSLVKRDHKLLDFDRFRVSLKKLQEKKDRSLSDEKQIFKLESQLEVATNEYEGLNNLLKEELPGYFWLRAQLMEPIFHAFYFLQLRICNILLDRIDPLARSGYYDLSMDVIQGYEARKEDIMPTLESVEVITKRSVATSYNSKYGTTSLDEGSNPNSPGVSGTSLENRTYSQPTPPVAKPWQTTSAAKPWQQTTAARPPQTTPKLWQAASASTAPPVTAPKPWQSVGAHAPPPAGSKLWQAATRYTPDSTPPPPYSSPKPAVSVTVPFPTATMVSGASSIASGAASQNGPNIHLHVNPFSIVGAVAATAAGAAIQTGKTTLAKKPPPPPVPRRLGVKMVVALYDYDAQQEGDLSFKKDDRIEIVERTDSTEDWWTGKLNGRQGVFPGNYVREA